MEFSGTNSANIPGSSHPSKKKQPYIRPQATVVTPDQAQEQVRAKAAPQSQEFEACSERHSTPCGPRLTLEEEAFC
jgi:hypothetical protein